VGDLIQNTKTNVASVGAALKARAVAPSDQSLWSSGPPRPKSGHVPERRIERSSGASLHPIRRKTRRIGALEGRSYTITLDDIRGYSQRLVSMSPHVETERRQTKEFLYRNLYYAAALEPEKGDAEHIITELFQLWMKHPEKLPESYREKAENEPLSRIICDYIAGMTDTYIYEQYEKFLGWTQGGQTSRHLPGLNGNHAPSALFTYFIRIYAELRTLPARQD